MLPRLYISDVASVCDLRTCPKQFDIYWYLGIVAGLHWTVLLFAKPSYYTIMSAAAMPRRAAHYQMNGMAGAVLPPDETTNEMAVDCPPSYVAAHPPRSATSTPRNNLEVPPPTPLDAGSAIGQRNKTTKDLEVLFLLVFEIGLLKWCNIRF